MDKPVTPVSGHIVTGRFEVAGTKKARKGTLVCIEPFYPEGHPLRGTPRDPGIVAPCGHSKARRARAVGRVVSNARADSTVEIRILP